MTMTVDRIRAALDRLNLHLEATAALTKAFADARGLPSWIDSAIERGETFRIPRSLPVEVYYTRSEIEPTYYKGPSVFTYHTVIRHDLALQIMCFETKSIVYSIEGT